VFQSVVGRIPITGDDFAAIAVDLRNAGAVTNEDFFACIATVRVIIDPVDEALV
jgi:hypothetical protein